MRRKTTVIAIALAAVLALSACGSAQQVQRKHAEAPSPAGAALEMPSPTPAPAIEPMPTATPVPAEEPAEQPAEQPDNAENGIRPEFKELMDSYEKFIDEYCTFMQGYMSGNLSTDMMLEYLTILAQYADFAEKIDGVDESELTDEELAYYIGVTARVSQKLLKIAG